MNKALLKKNMNPLLKDDSMWFFLAILAALACISLVLILLFQWKQKNLRKKSVRNAQQQWKKLDRITDPGRRILEAQSIIDRALNDMGYRGTFAEKLQRIQTQPKEFQDVWDALKLRNRIAHEPGTIVSPEQANTVLHAFKRFLHSI